MVRRSARLEPAVLANVAFSAWAGPRFAAQAASKHLRTLPTADLAALFALLIQFVAAVSALPVAQLEPPTVVALA